MSRPAHVDDVDAICAALPHTEFGTSWGDVPTWLVSDPATAAKPKGFLLYRHPHPSAIDPASGEPYTDLIVLSAADQGAKAALVEADGPFLTIDHFDGHDGYLVQASRLGEITLGELTEVITESWLRAAPPKLRRAYLAALAEPGDG